MFGHLLYDRIEQLSVFYIPQQFLIGFKHRRSVMTSNLFVEK